MAPGRIRMTRTASCFFALGIGIALAAACGDDDGGDGAGGAGGGGGSGGAGASGGAAGTGGDAGSGAAGTGGATAGAGGSAGTGSAGTGGSSGSTAGTAGTSSGGAAGTGEDPDAGPDGSVEDGGPDSSAAGSAGTAGTAGTGGTGPVDSGVNGTCDGFTTGPAAIVPQANQDVVIARVIFNDDDETATVVLRVTTAFSFGDPMQLCWGAEDEECVLADDGIIGDRAIGTELFFEVGSEDSPVNNNEGELLFVNALPSSGNADSPFAYVNWGDFDSVDPDGIGPAPTLEGLADTANFWTSGDSIDLTGTENAFFGNGDTDVDTGFGTCTADQF